MLYVFEKELAQTRDGSICLFCWQQWKQLLIFPTGHICP